MLLWSCKFHLISHTVDVLFVFLETGLLHSKPVYKKENGASDHAGSSSASGQSGNQSFYQFPSHRLNVI